MVRSIGVDVTSVERMASALERVPGLRARLFTAQERDLPVASLAARFAAKEAVAKALGSPGGMTWHDCEVTRGQHGNPTLVLRGTVAARAQSLGITRWHLSLSHDAGVAIAMVVAE